MREGGKTFLQKGFSSPPPGFRSGTSHAQGTDHISGFLGSGKTTLLRRLLEANRDRRIAVLLYDFGDAPVDGAILRRAGVEGGVLVEIGGGLVFCACLREPFVKALTGMAERDEDMVIVEASGMSDPATIGRMLTLSGSTPSMPTPLRCASFDPVKSLKLARVLEVIPRQLAAATVAVITKADVASPEELEAARAYIREKEPDLPVLESRNDSYPLRACPAGKHGNSSPSGSIRPKHGPTASRWKPSAPGWTCSSTPCAARRTCSGSRAACGPRTECGSSRIRDAILKSRRRRKPRCPSPSSA
ncbi:MAG: GTP-binding protein [Bilophila sp.]